MPSEYSPVERAVFARCVEAARIVGAPGIIDGLRDCIYGGLREVTRLDDDRAFKFLGHVLAEVDPTGEVARRLLLVLRPPTIGPSTSVGVSSNEPHYGEKFTVEFLDRGAIAATAFRLNSYPVASGAGRNGAALCRYAEALRAGIRQPHLEATTACFIRGLSGNVDLPDGSRWQVQAP